MATTEDTMISGTVRQDGSAWYVDHASASYSEPEIVTVSWRITDARRQANYGPAPELRDGLTVTLDHNRPWQAYEHGNYLVLDTEKDGTVRREPLPCPKVRKGTATRYRDGQWEKLMRNGWTRA